MNQSNMNKVIVEHNGRTIELYRPNIEELLKGGNNMQTGINKVKGYRNMINLSQADLANILGIDRRTYVAKENGASKFTQDELIKIRDVVKTCGVDITLDDLLL